MWFGCTMRDASSNREPRWTGYTVLCEMFSVVDRSVVGSILWKQISRANETKKKAGKICLVLFALDGWFAENTSPGHDPPWSFRACDQDSESRKVTRSPRGTLSKRWRAPRFESSMNECRKMKELSFIVVIQFTCRWSFYAILIKCDNRESASRILYAHSVRTTNKYSFSFLLFRNEMIFFS